ncbi:ABC transporter permease [Telmatospirillum sp.]|uniref:ABC transporter permease n=1 Tax=Telmatospirillum sp. TaxID=2079197 RepID=UPI00284E3895|nr:ABC transporter permease [Telmatospirillum sp.]MDR3441143.1 ABC transporter permease [Telmatospirillum sp.]
MTDAPCRQPSRLRLALQDLLEGTSHWWLWGRLGWQDILLRYRGSVLGPLWITLSMTLTVLSLAFLYSRLFHISLDHFLPFLCLGYLAWGLISGIIGETCTVFIAYSSVIKQTKIPFTSHVLRSIWRNYLIFFHNLVAYVLVALYFGIWPGWGILLSLLSLFLIFVNGMWIGLLLGLLAARFRDVPPIIGSLLQFAFFVTPIMWEPQLLEEGARGYLWLNPFYPFVSTFRGPLIGEMPDVRMWMIIGAVTVIGWALTVCVFARVRGRISYWI